MHSILPRFDFRAEYAKASDIGATREHYEDAALLAPELGVFAVAVISGASFVGAIPILGTVAGLVWGATWLYGVADAYVTGKKK